MSRATSFDAYLQHLHGMGLLPSAKDHPDFGQFSVWRTFDDALAAKVESWFLADFCGVYLVAVFPDGQEPAGRADPCRPDQLPFVVYVGRTRTKPLRVRWQQLRSAVNGDGGHSGGNTLARAFAATLGKKPERNGNLASRIRLAGLPVWVSKAQREPGDGADSRRQTCFRTAAIEAALIETISERKRVAGLPPMANDPVLSAPGDAFEFIEEAWSM